MKGLTETLAAFTHSTAGDVEPPKRKTKPLPAFKKCRRCETELPNTLEHFRRNQAGSERPSNTCKRCSAASGRIKWRQWRFGLSPAQYDALLESQGRVCALCAGADPKTRKGWHIDHDHVSGVVRGILCHPCNIRLGHVEAAIAQGMAVPAGKLAAYLARARAVSA